VSLQEVILERELFQGAGTRSPSTGAVPILFGLRLIHNPRIVWVKARDLPYIGTKDGQDPTIRYPHRFALLATLCHGTLDEITELWCNGKRLHWNWTGTTVVAEKSIIEETNFFSDNDLLTGHCSIDEGHRDAQTDGDKLHLYYGDDEDSYLRDAESAQVTPENKEVAYVGIAMAHLYISNQGSDSFNNWTFLCKRLPKFGSRPQDDWQSLTKQITVGTRKRFTDSRVRVRPRRYILAIDCTPINGIPVIAAQEVVEDGASIELAEKKIFSVPIPGMTNADVRFGQFRYRYDVIREGAVQLLENFRKKMLGEEVGYSWNLRVLFVSAHFDSGTTLDRDINTLKFTATGSQVFNEESIIPDTSRTNVDAVLDAIITGVTNHSTLRAATRTADPLVGFWWGLSHTVVPEGDDFGQIVASYITKQYSFEGFHLPTGINAGNKPFTDESDIYFPFFDWRRLFTWIAANSAKFDGFSSGDRAKPGQEDLLPQINIITGPTWPYRLKEFWTINDRGYSRYLYPNIDQCYQDALGLDAGGDAQWTYGTRPNPSQGDSHDSADPSTFEGLALLRHRLGANANWKKPVTGNDDDPQLIIDYRALDPFVWGRHKRDYPGSGSDVSDELSKDHAFPSYYDHLRLNIEKVDSNSDRVLIPNTVAFASAITTPTVSSPFNSADYNATDSVEGDPVNFIGGMGNNMGLALTNADYSFTYATYSTANPVHVIRECLLNKDWGRGRVIRAADLDDDITMDANGNEVKGSFIVAAEQVHKEKLGVGYLWDKQSTLDEVINDMLEHIDGVLYEDNGKLYLKLVGEPQNRTEEYRSPVAITEKELEDARTAGGMPKLTTANVTSITNLVVPREDELVNRVVLQYTPHYSRQAVSIHRENDDRIAKYGLKSKTVSYKGIIDKTTAGKVAQRDLIEEESGLISCNINMLPELADSFNPNDIVSLQWPELGIREGLFRIIKIRYGETRSNRTTLSVIQAVPGDIVDA